MTTVHRIALLLLLAGPLHAQVTPLDRARLPFAAVSEAFHLRTTMSLRELRTFVERRMENSALRSAADLFLTAELLKQLGDSRALDLYERAILQDPREPGYELFYADYLRNVRGPQHPLFAEAEEHYFAALRKVTERVMPPSAEGDDLRRNVLDRIDRGLVALYQEDGLPLRWSDSGQPTLFLSSVSRYARSTADLDEVHDARDFAAEALFAASALRLGRALTIEELRKIARTKRPSSDLERLRFRSEGIGLDVSYERRSVGDAQITSFENPGVFNGVKRQNGGVSVEDAVDHFYFRIGYSEAQRTGVVESSPGTREQVNQIDVRTVLSGFVGPDKANLELAAVTQVIKAEMKDSPRRGRDILGVSGDYEVLRPLPFLRDVYGQLFGIRGVHLEGGYTHDNERYGELVVTRRDVFAGAAIDGLGPFDVTARQSLFDSHSTQDPSQKTSQFRTDAALVVRLLDEERQPGIPASSFLGFHPAFVNLVLLIRRDRTWQGLDAFENDQAGAALNAKLFRRAFSGAPAVVRRASPTTVLFSARYDRQRLPRLDKTLRLFAVSLSLGY